MKNNRTCTREELLNTINEVSFAVNDITLYLDTHPEDQEAMEFFREKVMMRKEAMEEYARRFCPLTIDTADDDCSRRWEWVMQPWPWEGEC